MGSHADVSDHAVPAGEIDIDRTVAVEATGDDTVVEQAHLQLHGVDSERLAQTMKNCFEQFSKGLARAFRARIRRKRSELNLIRFHRSYRRQGFPTGINWIVPRILSIPQRRVSFWLQLLMLRLL